MIESYICWVGGNILRISEQVKRFVNSFFPSQVVDVAHHLNGVVETVYRAKSAFSTWSQAFCSNMYLPHEGFYQIRVWNSNTSSFQSYFLSSMHLEKALSSRNLFSWWAMTDFGIVTLLSSYISMLQVDKTYILGILIDGEDVTHILKPYLSSLCLRKNCTARSLCSLYYELVGVHPKKKDNDEVVIIDYEMVEHHRCNLEHLFE